MRSRVINRDEAGEKAAWQRASGYAGEAMELAPEVRNHPDYGTAFFNANMVLGMAAIKAGDAKRAASYLLKASDAPVTDPGFDSSLSNHFRLPRVSAWLGSLGAPSSHPVLVQTLSDRIAWISRNR